MEYLYVKALHIIFVVTWFAGLFYIFRLYIYHTEANAKDEPERSILSKQLGLMESRLWYIIAWPSAVLTYIFGIRLVMILSAWTQPWMLLKFAFVILLTIYHLYAQKVLNDLKKEVFKNTSLQLRLWNEGATVILIAVVFIIVFKDTLSWIWGIVGIFLIVGILMIAIKSYKKIREKNETS
ncbi:MAG: CopD family protein [Bacteroidota bacterium]